MVDRILLDNDIHYLVVILSKRMLQKQPVDNFRNHSRNPNVSKLYINTFGGDLYEAFALIDVMKNSYPISAQLE